MTIPISVGSRSGGGTGAALLVRLAARRDRVMISMWLAVLVLVCYASAAATTALYDTEADRVAAAEAINASPGIVALYGPILDVHSTGELAMTKMTVTYSVLVAVMMLFAVRRHTRVDEENGQAELLAGTAITSATPLRAAIGYGLVVSVVLGVLVASANVLGGLPAVGSLAFGASWTGTGLVAVSLTAVACQIAASARTCAAIAVSGIGSLFVLRAFGDTTDASWLSWLSPFGWNTRLRAYGETRWWVLLLYVALTAILVVVALQLRQRRDLGAGLTQPRPGPATGSPRLSNAIALNVRVHTPLLFGWTLAVAVMGLVFGAIAPSFDAFDSTEMKEMLQRIGGAGTLRDALLSAVVSVAALIITCFGVTVVVHAGNDEHDGRTEQVLATATSRSRAFLACALVSGAGATWLLLTTGVALALGTGSDSEHSFGTLVVSPLSQAPAVWVVLAVSLMLYAWQSRWAILGWAALVLFATLGLLGELLGLPQWVDGFSPYTHVPSMPMEAFSSGQGLALSGVAAAIAVAAWLRYLHRDIG